MSLMENRREVLHSLSWYVQSSQWSPPTDLLESNDTYIVRVEIAGMREDDFEVTLENEMLMIKGTRSEPVGRVAYHQMEIRFGKFSTAVMLPSAVKLEEAGAEYKDGFLTVTLPKLKSNQAGGK